MRALFILIVACGTSVALTDGGMDAATNGGVDAAPDHIRNDGTCTQPIAHLVMFGTPQPGYTCNTCITDTPMEPDCHEGKLSCGGGLVYCPCGAISFPRFCCDDCDSKIGQTECTGDGGAWACKSGHEGHCSVTVPCDSGTDATTD